MPLRSSTDRRGTPSGRVATAHRVERLESRVFFAAQVVLSEFMADNNATLADDTGQYSDWIELHNAGDATADLAGWSLTDDNAALAKWSFPAGTSLPAGGYLLVWASGLDRTAPGQPLHTNFKLSDGGEYLALVEPGGVNVRQQFAPTFPPQTSDVSYGLSDDNNINSPLTYFASPSPRARNVPNAAAVMFSKPGGGYAASFAVTLASATPGVQIRYTTNNSVPTTTSTLYTGSPITVNRDTIVRARAFGAGLLPSVTTSEQYFLLDSSTSSFHSNLPLVVLDTGGASVGENSQTPVTAMVIAPPAAGGDAALTQPPEYVGRAALNVRGQSSAGFPKKQYHLELWDENDADEKHSLLGMPSEGDWVLYAPYSEKALMQNRLAYQWATDAGQYAVRTRWVEVFVNTGAGGSIDYAGDYAGVYLLMEKIEIGDDRVDITKVRPGQDAAPEVTGGYLFHKDKPDPEDTSWIESSRGHTFLFEDPTPEELSAAQKAYLTGYINSFESALYGPSFADPQQGYAKYINVNSFIDHWIMVEMAKNIDGFRISTYYYKDRNGLITMGPVWDYNLSMGNANYNGGESPTGWYHDNISAGEYTYFDRLTQDPNFMFALASRWKELRGSVFATAKLTADIEANYGVLTNGTGNYPVGPTPTQTPDNPAVRNFSRWRILGENVWPNAYVSNSWLDEVNHLKDFITTRVAWMDGQLNPLVPDAAPGAPSSLTASAVSGVQVALSWTLADPLASTVLVERSGDGGATWTSLPPIAGSATSYVAGGLSAGTSYSFRVRASNALGTSGYSNVASATTTYDVPTLDFPDFATTFGKLKFNGNAGVVGGTAQLTPNAGNQTGSVWTVDQQDVRKFTTTFSFRMTNPQADGMTFTIQRASNAALGGGGGGLGFGGIANSLGVKFDLYPNLSTTGVYTNGASPGEDANAVNVTGVDFHAGHDYTCTLSYDGSTLRQTITDTSTGGSFSRAYANINLASVIGGGTAWIGFTAATGGATADMRVLSWSFTTINDLPPGVTASAGAQFTYANGTLSVTSGTLTFAQDVAASNVTAVASGPAARLVFNSGQHLVALTLRNGARATIGNSAGAASRKALVVKAISVDAASAVDIGNNALVYRYTGAGAAALSLISGLVSRGFNDGGWDGTGVVSAAAAADPTFTTAVGVADNAEIGYTSFADEPGLTGGEILVKYTYYGDADLSGRVDNADLLSFQDGLLGGSPTGWLFGDFDGDGVVGNSDLLAFQDGLLASRNRGLL